MKTIENLPNDGERVIISDGLNIETAYLDGNYFVGDDSHKIKAVFWMSFPKLPQPERSKREDCKCPEVERWTTGNPPKFMGKEKFCICGALNTGESQ